MNIYLFFSRLGCGGLECVQDTHAFDDQRKEIFNCTRPNQLKLQPLCMLFFFKKKKVAQHIYNKESR